MAIFSQYDQVCLVYSESQQKTYFQTHVTFLIVSKRIGWIPLKDELPAELISDFNLVIGLSVTEMEIVEAAYRKINPNCEIYCSCCNLKRTSI